MDNQAGGADDGDVTDNSGMPWASTPRAWKSVLAAGLAVLTAGVVGVVVVQADPAEANTLAAWVPCRCARQPAWHTPWAAA